MLFYFPSVRVVFGFWWHLPPIEITSRCACCNDRRLSGLMSQQKQNLQLTQNRKCPGGPDSPSAAKRLYRNLSEKLRGSTSSFEDTHFFGNMDRIRKSSVSTRIEVFFFHLPVTHGWIRLHCWLPHPVGPGGNLPA